MIDYNELERRRITKLVLRISVGDRIYFSQVFSSGYEEFAGKGAARAVDSSRFPGSESQLEGFANVLFR
jgi:hypothetical protein